MIPESPEAYVKLTENAIKNTSGRHNKPEPASLPPLYNKPPLLAHLLYLSQLCGSSMLRHSLPLLLLY